MPITPEYEWDETPETIRLYIQLRGTKPSAVDLFASDLYAKVNFQPYLLEVDLKEAINEDSSSARFKKGVLTVKLTKATPGIWGDLKATGDKASLRARRAESHARKEKKDGDLREALKDQRRDNERTTLRSQMTLEEDERQHIDGVREEIKQEYERDMYETLARVQAEQDQALEDKDAARDQRKKDKRRLQATAAAEGGAKSVSFGGGADTGETKHGGVGAAATATSTAAKGGDASKDIFGEEDVEAVVDSDNEEIIELRPKKECQALVLEESEEEESEESEEEELEYIPPPRQTAKLVVEFTDRVFPTPARESKRAEEEDWLSKNRKYIRRGKKNREAADARDISERDPVWLKGKGDDFYRARDFAGAVNAYTAALEADPKMAAALSNRAACNLQLQQFQGCVDDCSTLLALLDVEGDEEALPLLAAPAPPTEKPAGGDKGGKAGKGGGEGEGAAASLAAAVAAEEDEVAAAAAAAAVASSASVGEVRLTHQSEEMKREASEPCHAYTE